MNVELLLEHFDDLSDAPERISGIRRVILAYLLHASANSPDAIQRAAVMRESHAARTRERSRNINRKEPQGTSQVSHADLPPSLSDLPVDLFDRLGNVASIEKGLSQIQSTKPGPYPLVVTAEARSSSETFDFEGAAAIVPLVSSTGHGDASLKRLHYQEGRYAVGNILAVVKPICPDLVGARFIYEYLSAFKEELLVARMSGTANVSLTVNKLKEVPVPLLSGPVLSRIDELMALCDRLEAQQQERDTQHAALVRASLARFTEAPTPANLEFLFHPSYEVSPADLRKTILTLAVQGKLVPQDPNNELPSTEEFRIAAAALANSLGLRAPKEIIDEADPFFDIPVNWRWMTLADLGVAQTGTTPSKNDQAAFKGEIPFIKPADILPDDINYSNESLTRYGAESGSRLAPAGSLLMVCIGTIGKCNLINRECAFNQQINSLTPVHLIDPKYLLIAARSPYFQEAAQTKASSTTIPILNKRKWLSIPIPVPPLAEQNRIVAKVGQLIALVDELEQQLTASRATAEKLLTALVAELVNGKKNHASAEV
jgi:type I restriction enzyme S subunit